MVQLSKIYTRGGDKGKTSLGSGKRVLKHDLRIEAIGAVDEANACLGLIALEATSDMSLLIAHIQNDLFDLGADLCIPDFSQDQVKLKITPEHTLFLENQIDLYNAKLQPLTSFVLPGGSKASAFLHFARTVVRRAERRVSSLKEQAPLNDDILIYLNRLSDLLFVLARIANNNGANDVLWKPGASIA